MQNLELGSKIMSHYQAFLGDYIGVTPYVSNGRIIQLLGYGKAVESSVVFASLGFSNFSNKKQHPCEIVMAVDDDYDRCAFVMANALYYAIDSHLTITRGTLIEGINEVVEGFDGHGKTALYIADVFLFPDEFSEVNHLCDIYQAFFISNSEAEYIKAKGRDAFEALLEKAECDTIDINRPSLI